MGFCRRLQCESGEDLKKSLSMNFVILNVKSFKSFIANLTTEEIRQVIEIYIEFALKSTCIIVLDLGDSL